ncbi:hypothetical protein Q427_14920 [Halomonas sp. BC04]|nr:hypothetical protein Q427_14920 [Halomonas sp. BC04]
MDDDVKSLTRLPGVGKKTAERLIIEMRDRFPHWEQPADMVEAGLGGAEASRRQDPLVDAEAALVSLGYKPAEAAKMLSGLDEGLSTEAMIKAALTRRLAG